MDGKGVIRDRWQEGDSLWIKIGVDPSIHRYIVSKGFIAIDGTSLTICEVGNDWFSVMLIPHTQQSVVLPLRVVGDLVNLEVDVLAKLVERSVSGSLEEVSGLRKELEMQREEISTLKQQVAILMKAV